MFWIRIIYFLQGIQHMYMMTIMLTVCVTPVMTLITLITITLIMTVQMKYWKSLRVLYTREQFQIFA